jgi:hypothetical protein
MGRSRALGAPVRKPPESKFVTQSLVRRPYDADSPESDCTYPLTALPLASSLHCRRYGSTPLDSRTKLLENK